MEHDTDYDHLKTYTLTEQQNTFQKWQSLDHDSNQEKQYEGQFSKLVENHAQTQKQANKSQDFPDQQIGKKEVFQYLKIMYQEACLEDENNNPESLEQSEQSNVQQKKQQQRQLKKFIEDVRKMVSNSSFFPYNCLGKIRASFIDPKNPNFTKKQWGTAFLISPEHIMTAYHTLICEVYCPQTKGITKLSLQKINFFPEPLFLDQKLANGIKATVLLRDKRFETSDWSKRAQFDWAVLKIHPISSDYRTKHLERFLQCDFDYQFDKQKQSEILILGYPDATNDIVTIDKKQQQKQSQNEGISEENIGQKKQKEKEDNKQKIKRDKQDLNALYYVTSKAHQQKDQKFLLYHHSTSKGTSGAPLIIHDPKTNRHKVVGIHIRMVIEGEQNIKVGLLLKSIKKHYKIKQKIQQSKEKQPMKIEASNQRKELNIKQILKMVQGEYLCLSYNLQCEYKDPLKCLKEIIKNASKFPLLYFLQSSSALVKQQDKINDQIFIEFTERGHLYSRLTSITIVESALTDNALIALFKNSARFPNLEDLNLRDNLITGHKFNQLSQFTRNLEKLKVLQLNSNSIDDLGLKNFSQNCKILPNLHKIILSSNGKISDEGFSSFIYNAHNFPSMVWISFNNTNIGDKSLQLLSQKGGDFPNLDGISFQKTKITDNGLKAIARSKNLKKLKTIYLNFNELEGQGFEQLVTNGQNFMCLQEINLKKNKITDEGLSKFINSNHFKKLKKIFLTNNLITHQGLIQLINSQLRAFPDLLQFDVAINKVNPKIWKQQIKDPQFKNKIAKVKPPLYSNNSELS